MDKKEQTPVSDGKQLNGRIGRNAEGVYLTALEEADLPLLLDVFNDPGASGFYVPTLLRPYSEEQLKGMLATWNDRSETYVYGIRDGGDLVGIVNLDAVNWVNRNAELGVALLSPKVRGKGYASRALRLLLEYVFLDAGFHRVYCRIMGGNEPSMQLFQRLGFRHEGVSREQVYRNGSFIDLHLFGLLRAEWEKARS